MNPGREIIGPIITACGILAVAPGSPAGESASRNDSRRPNVLVIIADDLGYGELGFMGNGVVRTPNLDRLAAQSALFKNFVVAPACSPTRSSFLTGRNHLSAGVWGVGPRGYTLRDETLMPRFFQSAGYGTCYFGKSDGVRMLELMPWDRGCDDAFTGLGGYVHRDPTIAHRSGIDAMKGWTCDINVEQALDYIRLRGDKPWWATVAFIVPHLPWVCDEKYSAAYLKQGCTPTLATFYGCVTQMDDAVGRLLDGLRESGQDRDTVVVFFSDNGPSYKGMTDAEIADRNVAGLKGSKATAWDNGIREPLLVRWPGKIKPGERPQFASVEDLLPTLIDLAHLPQQTLPEHLPFDGISLCPALEDPGSTDPERAVFRIAIAGEGSPRDHGRTGVIADPRQLRLEDHHVTLRGNRFKFHFLPDGSTALYDLSSDPGETSDVSAKYPEIAADMAKRCRAQWDSIISGGRAFKMPVVIVGGTSAPGINKIDASLAQRVGGHVRGMSEGVKGFASAGDTAEFAVEVRDAGQYKVVVGGDADLGRSAELSLSIAGVKLAGLKKSPGTIEFGPVSLAAGPATAVLAVEGVPPKEARAASIERIVFFPSR